MSETLYDKLKGPGPDLSGYSEARPLGESETSFLQSQFESARSEGGCFVRLIWSIVIVFGGGSTIYTFFEEGITEAILCGIGMAGVAIFLLQIGLPMAKRQASTMLEESQPLIRIDGLFRVDYRATGTGTKVYIDNVPVSIPRHWKRVFPAHVEAEVYPTNSGEHLVLSMRYKDPEAGREATRKYARKSHGWDNGGHFSIAGDIEQGKLPEGKKLYRFYG